MMLDVILLFHLKPKMKDFYDLTPEAKEARTITKDWDVRVVNKELKVDITLLVGHVGHNVPLPMNTIITAMFHGNNNMTVFDKIEIEENDWKEIDKHRVHVLPGTKGIVIEHIWHIDSHDLTSGTLSLRRLTGVTSKLWYLVKFSVGNYWVRYDWLEPYSSAGAL